MRARPRDPAGARAECARRGGDPALAGALAGLGAPVDDSARAGELPATLAAIRSTSAEGDALACRGSSRCGERRGPQRVPAAGPTRSSTNVFHSWQCGQRHSMSSAR